MSDLSIRLKARAYVALTGVFYLLVGLAYTTQRNRLDAELQPSLLWCCAFVFVGIISLFAWFSPDAKLLCRSLYAAAGMATGFASMFLLETLRGDLHYLFGALLWAYISAAHFSVARLPDPYLVALFEKEAAFLKTEIEKARAH